MTDIQTPAGTPADHRAAKAEAKAAKAHAKAMRPWFKKKRFMFPLIIVVIAAFASMAGGGSEDADVASGGTSNQPEAAASNEPDTFSNNETNRPQDDVSNVTCESDEFGFAEAKIDVTNNSSGRSSYFIDVSFESEDGSRQFATGMAVINNLEPGQSSSEVASSITEIGEAYTCRIVEVNRMAS